ncbi:hypothetical protein JKF63_00553 [Porcisia hertigi]|uniref:Uncharacterized protein n=1 Tax=Porcisia hertigi TaxID=2761500 RepID=A0A836L702_9TRYP|nr:hypothetical protein JKF63_00553 [Porcisia hertigi]
MALKCTRAPASFADDGATPIDRFSTNSPVASVKVAVDDDDTSTYDSVHTPGRCGSNAAGSTGIREDSVSVLDPHVSTAEPTPMKTAPVTARYRDEGSHPFAASTGAPVKVSTSPMPVSPLLHHASRRNSEFSGGMQQSVLSSGRDGTEGEEGDRQAFGVTKTFRTCLTADQNIPPETLGDTSEEIYERSISLMAEPMSQISSLPQQQQQQQSAPTSPPREFSPSANASRIKGDEAFPSWDAKAYCGDVASVLVVKDLDMDTMTPVFKSQTSWIHASQGAASSAIGEEEARGQAPVVHVPPTHAPLSPTYYEASETVAHETISEHGVAAAPGAFPVPQSPPALLPVFSSRFPWNDVLVDRLMVYALPPLIAKSVGTVTTVPHLALGKGRLDGEKKAVVLTNAQEEEEEETNVFETSRGDLSPPLPPSHVGISRTAAPLTRSTRRQSDSEDDREDSSELCRATGSSLAKETGLRRLARSSSANAVTAVVPSSRAFRQAKFSNRSTSISVSGSSSSAAVGEPVSAPSVHETASPQSGEIQKAATEQVELTTLTDSVPPMPSEQCLPLHPLRRLALCTVTAREVRQRAGQSAGDIARSTLEFGNRVEEPSVAPLTQDAVREFVADATSKGSGAPSLSVADSIEDRSSRRTAASRDSPHQPQPPSFVPSAPPDTATQRIMARLLEKWQREMDVKFKWCTHVLILFGAGWHPGMASFLRAVRSLCRVINAPKDALTDAPAFGKEIAPNGCGDERQTHVGLGVPGMRGFDRYLNAEEGDAAPFTSLKGFSESSVEWNGNGAGGFAGGFGGIDSRCDTRSFSSLTGVDAHGGNVSDDGARMAGVSPHGGAATGASKPAAAASSPSRRVQVIYISADESLQAVCSAMADMPADWLCVSPYVAQSTPEGDLQKHVSDMARSIFRVNSFPRMVVVELPYAQQQHQRHQSENPVRKEAAHAGDSSAESKYGVEDESGDAVGTSTTLHDATAASPNRSEPQFDGLWTVVQLHGENNLCTDPEGKNFPWSSDSADVLRVEEEDVSPALRRRQHEEEVLHPTLSSDPSPLSEGSNPDACEDGLSLRSLAEQVTASGTPTKAVASSKCDAALVKYVVSLYRPVARLFPPIKPFLVADGELPTLLERGGYFVVLGAFGSVDSQLHQQCLSALDEVRQWLYAEIEERKRQAWSEPTQLQVMAPHSAYGGCFTARGDVVVGTPAAYQTTTGGTAGIDEHGLPTRYSPSVAAVTPLNVPTDSGDPFAAAALHRLSLGNSGSRRGSTPMIFEDGWPEARGGTTSPRYGVAGFPMSGSPPIQLDAPSGLHGLRLGGAPSLASAPAAHKANASHRLLPTVYFYDSIFSSVPVPQTLPPTTAPDRCRGAARGRGVHCADEEKSLRGKATPLRQPSPAAAGAPARASPRRRSGGFEGAAAAAAASIPSHAPFRRVFDNTSALRRSHAKDLALFQEYILSPILESDGRQLPVREGEVYLACVRWPQRTCAVLQSCLGSEARPPAPVLATTVGSTAPLTAASTSSTTAGGLVCGGNVCPTPGSGTGLRSLTVSHSPGAGQLLPEPILRRSSVSSGVSPPTNSPLTAAPASGNVTAAASAAAAGGNHVSSNLSATFSPAPVPSSASPAETHSESGSAGGTTTGLNSPPLASTNMHISAFTSLSNTILIEEHGKEGSPDPEATPLASAESIKSFLYDNILRLMEA